MRITLDFRLFEQQQQQNINKKKKDGFTIAGENVQEKELKNQCQSFVGHSDFAERVISAVRSFVRS